MLYLLLGVGLIALCLAMVWLARPAAGGTEAWFVRHHDVASLYAVLATMSLGAGFVLFIIGLASVW